VVYSLFFIPPKNLGDPGSSRGTLEHIRVDLTPYMPKKARNISWDTPFKVSPS
jgi:hypothetical protein